MNDTDILGMMEHHGVKATANRLVIARALAAAARPLSLMELEAAVETIDKSNIFRTLTLFREARLVHALEDTGEGTRYELCRSHHDDEDDDLHPHFYCTACHRTFCLHGSAVPSVDVPEGYVPESVSCLVRGVCPDCRKIGRV